MTCKVILASGVQHNDSISIHIAKRSQCLVNIRHHTEFSRDENSEDLLLATFKYTIQYY